MPELLGITLILSVMGLGLLVFAVLNKSPVYRTFFFLGGLWFLFLTLNISRTSTDIVETRNNSVNIYNATGHLTSQENSSITTDLTYPNSTTKLLDTANFTWLWTLILLSIIEFLYLIVLIYEAFGGKKSNLFNL